MLNSILPLLVTAFLSTIAFAKGGGVVISGGGHGVLENGKIYLLDLYEHRNHENPFFPKKQKAIRCEEPLLENQVSLCLNSLDSLVLPEDVKFLVLSKIDEISRLDPVFAMSVLEAVRYFEWVLTDDSLRRLQTSTPMKLRILQLAVRTENQVLIQRKFWNLMNLENKTALILHEAVAALADLELKSDFSVRFLVSNLLSPFFDDSISENKIIDQLQHFPSVKKLRKLKNFSGHSLLDKTILISRRESGGLRFDMNLPGLVSNPTRPVENLHFIPWAKILLKDGSEKFILLNHNLDLESGIFGDTNVDPENFLFAQFGTFKISVQLHDQLQEGSVEPRLTWFLQRELRAQKGYWVQPEISDLNHQQDELIQLWLKDFIDLQILMPNRNEFSNF